MITAPKMARERRHPCLHDFIYCGQDGRAPGCIFIIACERSSWYLLRKWPGSAGILACMLSIYCGQDGRAPGCIFIIVCERSSWYLLRKWPGSAGIPACMIPSTAARMAALPGAFSLLCVSVRCYENNTWERRHPCLHASIYCGQDGRAPGCIFIIVCELRS